MAQVIYAKKINDVIEWREQNLSTAMYRMTMDKTTDAILVKMHRSYQPNNTDVDILEEYDDKLNTWIPYRKHAWVLLNDYKKILIITLNKPDPVFKYRQMYRDVATNYYQKHKSVPEYEFL